MIAPVPAFPNVNLWKREMKWMRLLQTRNVKPSAHIRPLNRDRVIVPARMYALPICPKYFASCQII